MLDPDSPPDNPTDRASEVLPKAPDPAVIECVQRACRGDRAAHKQLCAQLLPMFDRVASDLCRRFCPFTKQTARQMKLDLLQEICLRFMEEQQDPQGVLSRWQASLGPLEAFLRPFAMHRGIDALRRGGKRWHVPMDDLAQVVEQQLLQLHGERPPGQPDLENLDLLRKLAALIVADPKLGPEAWTLIERVFWKEEDRKVIAASYGIRDNTLDRRIVRLRAELSGLAGKLGLSFSCRYTKRKATRGPSEET